jgi:hypothetical protein
MKRMLTLFLAAPALAVLLLAGCGGGDKKTTTGDKTGSKKGEGGKGDGGAAKKGGVIEPGDGKIVGRVVFDGDPPKPAPIADLPKHQDKEHCLSGPEAHKVDQTWKISKDGGVADTVIYLSAPKGSEFKVVEAKGKVTLDQPFCAYVPHVFAIRPGQKLDIKNSAAVLHNTKWEGEPGVNPPQSPTIQPGKSVDNVELKPQADPITFRCDVHKWMEAKCFAWEHQYIVVTDADGKFVLENVPTGVELNVVGWHESAAKGGYFYGGKNGTKHTFKSGENNLGNLKVSAK